MVELKETMRMHQDAARPVATDRALLQRCQQLVAAWEVTDQTLCGSSFLRGVC